jgi:hypothetical protein
MRCVWYWYCCTITIVEIGYQPLFLRNQKGYLTPLIWKRNWWTAVGIILTSLWNRLVYRVNCCWTSPAQSFLVSHTAELMTLLSGVWWYAWLIDGFFLLMTGFVGHLYIFTNHYMTRSVFSSPSSSTASQETPSILLFQLHEVLVICSLGEFPT